MTTDLVETGCSTLSHADLWVTAETAEGRVKLGQEARRVGEHQHGLRGRRSEVLRSSHGPPAVQTLLAYRQVVAAVAADQC